MFFSNQSRRHTQLDHKVVREPGYESEAIDWENLFVNITNHQRNRLENIKKKIQGTQKENIKEDTR